MDNNENKSVKFSCQITFGNKEVEDEFHEKTLSYGSIISIDYSSKTKVGLNEQKMYKKILDDYVGNDITEDNSNIVDIVRNIRSLTEGLDESKLNIRVYRDGSGDYVYYKNGLVESSGSYIEEFDNTIYVYTDKKGTEVSFKREDFYLDSEEKLNTINNILCGLYQTVISLNQMIKPISKEENQSLKLKK